MQPLCTSIDQIGAMVDHLEDSIKAYEKIFGKGIFHEVHEATVVKILDDGQEIKIRAKAAFAQIGKMQLELIQIIDGPAEHLRWLEQPGRKIHVGVYVTDFDKSLKQFIDAGIKVLHLGRGRARYAYMDTKPLCIEIIETRMPSEKT